MSAKCRRLMSGWLLLTLMWQTGLPCVCARCQIEECHIKDCSVTAQNSVLLVLLCSFRGSCPNERPQQQHAPCQNSYQSSHNHDNPCPAGHESGCHRLELFVTSQKSASASFHPEDWTHLTFLIHPERESRQVHLQSMVTLTTGDVRASSTLITGRRLQI